MKSPKPRPLRRLSMALILVVIGAVLFASACSGSEGTASTAAPAAGESGSIVFEGLVDNPMTLTSLDMDYMSWESVTVDDPTLGTTTYEGVRLSEIFSYVGVQPDAKTLTVTSSDGSSTDIALADVISDTAMIAVADDGNLSTVMPGLGSEAWVDDVVAMTLR